jgi:hypothetical protein
MNDKANVRIRSNVFPVTTIREVVLPGRPTSYGGVCDDSRFRRQIRGKAALKKLAESKHGATIYERSLRDHLLEANLVEKWQVEVFWDQQGGGGCVDCPVGARPFGVVARGGRCVVENRCKKPGCRCR